MEIYDVVTREKTTAFPIPEGSYGVLYLSQGNLLWIDENARAEEDNYYLYTIEKETLSKCKIDNRYHTWSRVGNGWFCVASSVTGKDTYCFIKTEDFSSNVEIVQIN